MRKLYNCISDLYIISAQTNVLNLNKFSKAISCPPYYMHGEEVKDYVDTSTAIENEMKHELSKLSSDEMSGCTNEQLQVIENATTIA